MAITVPTGGRLVRILFGVIALGLAALTLRTGLGFALAGRQPALATRIDSGNARALAALAEQTMTTAADDDDVAEVARLSRAALLASPLEVTAVRNAGFVMAVAGDEARARRLLGLAGEASLRDYLTHAWLLNEHFRENQVFDAIVEADIVLRQNVATWPVVLPELAGLLSDERTIEPLARTLAGNPYWRGSFLQALGGEGVDRDAAYALMLRLKALGAPASTVDRQPYFTAIASADPRFVHRRWLALLPTPLPPGQTMLRDGGFAGLDAPGPFNWTFYPRDGVYAERAAAPEGEGRVLYLAFDGTNEVSFASQRLVLPPGSYRVRARARSDGAIGPEQFAFDLRCSRGGGVLSRAALPAVETRWSTVALDIVVPANCAAQDLWFIGRPSETLDPAAIWVDDVTLVRR